jgi:hypothetical protein
LAGRNNCCVNDIATADDDLLKVSVQKSQTSYTQTPPTPTPASLAADEKAREAKRRIKLYLENCARIPVFPTLKQVQSAIHRPRGLPINFTCDEIGSLVKDLGLLDKVSPVR